MLGISLTYNEHIYYLSLQYETDSIPTSIKQMVELRHRAAKINKLKKAQGKKLIVG